MADVCWDEFSLLFVNAVAFGQSHEYGFAVAQLALAGAADDLLGRSAIDLLGKDADGVDPASGAFLSRHSASLPSRFLPLRRSG